MRYKASITVFMAFLLLSLLFVFTTIIEYGRISAAKAEAELNIYNSQRSLAGHYHRELWEKYDILGLDFRKNRKDLLMQYLNDNAKAGKNIFNIKYDDVNLIPKFFNEDGGYELVRQAKKCMLYRLPNKIIDSIKGGDNNSSDQDDIKDMYEVTDDDIEKARNEKYNEETKKDPRDVVDKIKDDTSFSEFTYDKKISDKKIDSSIKIVGNLDEMGILDGVLFNEYILSHFTSAISTDENEDKVNYEVEYILCGHDNDKDNLNEVLRNIKLIRIPINLAFLTTNKKYSVPVNIAAIFIGGLTANLTAINGIKYAILTAWAYAESAIDVKNLLAGGKVPIVKSEDTWNLSWSNLFTFWNIKPKSSDKGMDYEDYLRMFLLVRDKSEKVRCSMNIIQNNVGVDFMNLAYSYMIVGNYNIDKKFFSPIHISDDIYKEEFNVAYAYR